MKPKYGIKFSGPRRKNIWWMDYVRNRVMTFDDPNAAYRWSDDGYTRFPHCQYLVMEFRDGQEKEEGQKESPT